MSTPDYNVNALKPDMQGEAFWRGSVETDNMSGFLVANGLSSGPFTGLVTPSVGNVSNNATRSTFPWSYSLATVDTAAEGTYSLCLNIIHADGKLEVIKLPGPVPVRKC